MIDGAGTYERLSHLAHGIIKNSLSFGCFRASYLPDFAVVGLKLYLGAERINPNMTRSDHVSFWENEIRATTIPLTFEIRTVTAGPTHPGRSNYDFLASVTKVLIASVLAPAPN